VFRRPPLYFLALSCFSTLALHCAAYSVTGTISTYAGTGGVSGSSGDGGLAVVAKLNSPKGVWFDGFGGMFIGA
jgi:hypothetical protein